MGAPTDDPLEEGQFITEEIEASVQGYKAQVNHTIFVGGEKTPGFNYYKAGMEVAIKLFYDTLGFIVPGKTTLRQIMDYHVEQALKLGVEEGTFGVVFYPGGVGNIMRPTSARRTL